MCPPFWNKKCFCFQGIRTTAKKDGSDYIINGSKVYISNGITANTHIVVAVTNAEAKSKAHGISLFIVEDDMPGFKKGKNLKKLGLKGILATRTFQSLRLQSNKYRDSILKWKSLLNQEPLTVFYRLKRI